MTTVRPILRCIQRLNRVPSCRSAILNRSVRCASTLPKKVIKGANGENIIASPFGEFCASDTIIQDYIFDKSAKHDAKTALVCGVTGREYTYAQSKDAVTYMARSLRHMGFKKGDVIALLAPNYPETILSFLGIISAELVVTTINPFATADEISNQLKSSGAKGMVTVTSCADLALQAKNTIMGPKAPVIVFDDGVKSAPEGTIPFKDVITRGKTLEPLGRSTLTADDLAILPYSSGTTGLPKGVLLTHKNLVADMEMLNQTAGFLWSEATDSYQEVVPLVLPFFHIFGLNGVTLPFLTKGAKIVTIPKFTPELFLSLFYKHKNTVLCCAPPLILFLSMCPTLKREHLESLHVAVCGAAPLSKIDVDRLYDRFNLDVNSLKFCQGYGLTETSPVAFFEITGTKYWSIGKNIVGCDARIIDLDTSKDISSPNQTGELWIRGPHIMKGYLNNEAATKETIVDGEWLRTGDVAFFDENHDFHITDRFKELIKVKGFQVPPAELEALLKTHPHVMDAAVVGIPDERFGEVPRAFVLPKKDCKPSEEDIKNFVKGKVSKYKHLEGGVMFVDEIPKSAAGKILRRKLKQDYLS